MQESFHLFIIINSARLNLEFVIYAMQLLFFAQITGPHLM